MGYRYIEVIDGDPEGRWPKVCLPNVDDCIKEMMREVQGWLAVGADDSMTIACHSDEYYEDGSEIVHKANLGELRDSYGYLGF